MTSPKGNTLRSQQILKIIRRLVPWLAVGCVVFALLPRAAELKLCLIRMNTEYLVIALALCLAYWFLNAGVWSGILESLGFPLPYFTGMRVWLTSESLRWLPGVIWKFCSRVNAASGLGVPVAIASISLPIELAVVVITWGIVAFAGLALSGLGTRILGACAAWLAPICVAILVVLFGLRLAWPVFSRQPRFRAALDRLQTVLGLHLKPRPLIRSGLVYTVLNIFHGVGFWLMLAGMGYQHSVSPAAAIGANAVGWIVGSLAIIFPGGIGVREASVALILSPLMPWQEATLAAALWRALQIVAELAALLPWLFIGGTERRPQLAEALVEERP
jgi:glycosyltransferase 2 family protein